MKRIILSLIVTCALALLAAPQASAAAPIYCGHRYAMLITGAYPSSIQQDGTATQPGALTHAVGVGVINFALSNFSPRGTCTATGELIYNAGDFQTTPAGVSFGPDYCYDGVSAFGGVPCFDGANHFSSVGGDFPSHASYPGVNGNGSTDLLLDVDYNWFGITPGSNTFGPIPFAFTLQASQGGLIIVGTSKAAPGAPILTLTMQRIETVPEKTTYGAAPYLGDTVVSCQSWGANQTDIGSAFVNPPGIAGAAGSVVGQAVIFPASLGLVPPGGGSLSFNSNDNIQTMAPAVSNNDCAIDIFPGQSCSTPLGPGCVYGPTVIPSALSQYADSTSNSISFFGTSGSDCSNDLNPGAGYSSSSVQWGTADTQSYLTTTAVFIPGLGFVPPGGEDTCTKYYAAGAGGVSVIVPTSFTPTRLTVATSSPTTFNIRLTNSSPADCVVNFAFTGGTTNDGNCSLSVSPSAANVLADVVNATASTISCACSTTVEDPSAPISATLTFSSTDCPLSGGTPNVTRTITCDN